MEDYLISVKDYSKGDELISFPCKDGDPNHNNMYWNNTNEINKNGAYAPENDALHAAQVVNNLFGFWYHRPILASAYNTESGVMPIQINVHVDMSNASWDPISKELYRRW